jgi:hypothetical protein
VSDHAGICKLGVYILSLSTMYPMDIGRRVWRYQRSNHNPYIEEEQTIQLPKEGTNGQTTIYKTQHIKLKIE